MDNKQVGKWVQTAGFFIIVVSTGGCVYGCTGAQSAEAAFMFSKTFLLGLVVWGVGRFTTWMSDK